MFTMHDYNDSHWHWYHWLLIILAVLIVMGLGYTLINNVKNNDNKSYVRGTEQTIEHPIDSTQNAIQDIVK